MEKLRTVLVVDDDAAVRETLKRLIERSGATCLVAENGPRALQTLREHEVQVVISDHDMPAMDGVELLKLVATRYPHISRVLLTGRTDAGTAQRAINIAHADRYLTKPWRNNDLLTMLYFAFEAAHEALQKRALAARLRRAEELIAAIREAHPGVVEALELKPEAA